MNVIFRVCIDNADVIALFPNNESWDRQGNISCYQHVGQHGGANWSWVLSATRPAQAVEYADLLRELKGIGYTDLTIRKRRTYNERTI